MTVGYRSILRLDDRQDALRVANDQFRSWLLEKVRDSRSTLETADWNGPGRYELGPDAVLTVVDEASADSRIQRLMLEYVEGNHYGVWTTRLYAVSDLGSSNGKQVLWIESEGENPATGGAIIPATPRLVRNTLETVDAFESSVPILSAPRIVRTDDVEETFRYITDADRHVSVIIVAPIPGVHTEQWASALKKLTRDTLGCASVFVPEPDAATTLNALLGDAHQVPPGAIRTFVPGINIEDRSDSRRHRILTPKTIVQNIDERLRFHERLIRTIAVTPRVHLLEAGLPSELLRTARVLQNKLISVSVNEGEVVEQPEDSLNHPVEVQKSRPSVSTMTEPNEPPGATAAPLLPWLGHLKNLVVRVLGRDTIDEAALESLATKFISQQNAIESTKTAATKLQQERERLEDSLIRLRQQLENVALDLALSEEERRDAEKRVRSLEHWKAQRPDSHTYIDEHSASWETGPVSCAEIVERLIDDEKYGEVTQYITLTDPEKAIDDAYKIDEIDPNMQYASSFWEYILVLRDYMISAESGFSGNVHMYLNSPDVAGRKCPANRHKSNESKTVQSNSRFRKERTFKVPEAIDPSGKLFMTKHFASTHRDQNAPRMYYEVETQNTKKAYIGYMGVHLSNTKTN